MNNTENEHPGPILVTGATGRQGSAVVDHLLKSGWPVRGMTRNPESDAANALRARGVEPVKGDFDSPETLRASMDGVYGVYSVQDFWEAGYDGEIRQGKQVIDCAVEAGVSHLVYSSVGGAERTFGQGIHHFETKHLIEKHLLESGLRWTIFRPVTFFENFITWRYVRTMHDRGIFQFPFCADRPFQMIAVQDLGAFVAAAFDRPDTFSSVAMELASQQLTMDDFAEAVSDAMGRPVRFRRLSMAVMTPILHFIAWTGQMGRFRVGPSMIAQGKWHRTTAPATGGWCADIAKIESYGIPLTSAADWARTIDWAGLRAAYD